MPHLPATEKKGLESKDRTRIIAGCAPRISTIPCFPGSGASPKCFRSLCHSGPRSRAALTAPLWSASGSEVSIGVLSDLRNLHTRSPRDHRCPCRQSRSCSCCRGPRLNNEALMSARISRRKPTFVHPGHGIGISLMTSGQADNKRARRPRVGGGAFVKISNTTPCRARALMEVRQCPSSRAGMHPVCQRCCPTSHLGRNTPRRPAE